MRLDRLGMGLSVACALHCLALPFLALFAGSLHTHEAGHAWLEGGMVGGAAAIGYLTLGAGYRRHRQAGPLLLLTLGLAAILLAHRLLEETPAAAVSVCGALGVLAAQLLNRRLDAAACPAACCAPSGEGRGAVTAPELTR